jgi:hypothetical protein
MSSLAFHLQALWSIQEEGDLPNINGRSIRRAEGKGGGGRDLPGFCKFAEK